MKGKVELSRAWTQNILHDILSNVLAYSAYLPVIDYPEGGVCPIRNIFLLPDTLPTRPTLKGLVEQLTLVAHFFSFFLFKPSTYLYYQSFMSDH